MGLIDDYILQSACKDHPEWELCLPETGCPAYLGCVSKKQLILRQRHQGRCVRGTKDCYQLVSQYPACALVAFDCNDGLCHSKNGRDLDLFACNGPCLEMMKHDLGCQVVSSQTLPINVSKVTVDPYKGHSGIMDHSPIQMYIIFGLGIGLLVAVNAFICLWRRPTLKHHESNVTLKTPKDTIISMDTPHQRPRPTLQRGSILSDASRNS